MCLKPMLFSTWLSVEGSLRYAYAPCMEYLTTKLGHKKGVNVGKYASTVEH